MMETRRLILFLLLGLALILLYFYGVAWMDKHHPGALGTPPATQPETVAQSNQPSSVPSSQQAAGTQGSAPGIGAAARPGPARIVATTQNALPSQDVSLGSANKNDSAFTMDLAL